MPLIYTLNSCFIPGGRSGKTTQVSPHPKFPLNLCINESDLNAPVPFALVEWLNPVIKSFSSIGEAKRILIDKQKLWNYYPHLENGRGKLIEEQLSPIRSSVYKFLAPIHQSPIGAWTLLGKNKLLFSSATSSIVPFNIFNFEENKDGPPSRAYLKLWEFFTRTRLVPRTDLHAIDLGACPGGWTWVLSTLFSEVLAIDKSPLRPDIQKLKNVEFLKQDVMQYSDLKKVEKFSWIFSDVALAPEKITSLLLETRKQRPDISFICTLKFTNSSNLKILSDLKNLPNSNVIHLFNNKHEVTWYSINKEGLREA